MLALVPSIPIPRSACKQRENRFCVLTLRLRFHYRILVACIRYRRGGLDGDPVTIAPDRDCATVAQQSDSVVVAIDGHRVPVTGKRSSLIIFIDHDGIAI